MSNLNFRKDIKTTVSTSCLIEDYQALRKAIMNQDWEEVEVVCDCLASVIESFTEVPADLSIKPSPSSIIAPSCKQGILLNGTEDVNCVGGQSISLALSGGVCQCSESCQYYMKSCFPDENSFHLILDGTELFTERTAISDEAIVRAIEQR